MKFTFTPLEIPDVLLVEHETIGDARGFVAETYREDAFGEAGLPRFVQDTFSRSAANVVRGLHYQLSPRPVGKLVRCSRGAILDVAVDLRRGAPTYGRWAAAELSAANRRMLWVPRGFAHGFCALGGEADVVIKVDAYSSPEHARCIRWNDPALGIPWPIAAPVLSPGDARAPLLADAENNLHAAQLDDALPSASTAPPSPRERR